MADKYNDAKAVLLNNGQDQILPVSKAQLIELANGDKQKFTGYDVDTAYTVSDALTYLLNKGNADLTTAQTYTGTSIQALDASVSAEQGYVLKSVTEADGKLTSYEQVWLDASVISYQGTGNEQTVQQVIDAIKGDIAAITGGEEGVGSISAQINAAIENLDVETISETGKPIVSVGEADGLVTATAGNISSAYVDVENTNNKYGENNDTVEEVLSYLLTTINNNKTAGEVTIERSTSDNAYAAVYTIKQGGTALNTTIDIPLDMVATNGSLVYTRPGENDSEIEGTYICMTIANGDPFYIDVKKLVEYNEVNSTSEITLTNNNHIIEATVGSIDSSKITYNNSTVDSALTELYSLVGGGDVSTQINNAINALDSVVGPKNENGIAYAITSVEEVDGKLTNVGYIGLSDENIKTTFASTDALKTLVGSSADVSTVKNALNELASIVSTNQGNAIENIAVINGTYVGATGSFANNTYTLTIDDSSLGNVSNLNYNVLEWTGSEVVTILNANEE